MEDYLLEVILSDVYLTTKYYREKIDPKKPRFADMDLEIDEEKSTSNMHLDSHFHGKDKYEVDMDGPIDPGTGEVVVRIKALDLPFIDITEDQESEGRKWEKKEQIFVSDSPPKKSFKHGPNSKSNAVFKKKFNKGKSVFFQMNYKRLMPGMCQTSKDIFLSMFRVPGDNTCLGRGKLQVPESFIAAAWAAHRSSVMRHIICTHGPIFPDKVEFKKSLKEKRKKEEKFVPQPKEVFIMGMKQHHRFRNVYEIYPSSKCCSLCQTCACCSSRQGQKETKRKHEESIDLEELMDPSPEPIKPETLPISASVEKHLSFVNESNEEMAIANVYIRLTCFGNALQPQCEECSNGLEELCDDENSCINVDY